MGDVNVDVTDKEGRTEGGSAGTMRKVVSERLGGATRENVSELPRSLTKYSLRAID